MYGMKLIFDIYPMINTHYTGIPQMTWNLARQFLQTGVDCLYTMGHYVLPRPELERLVDARSGSGLCAAVETEHVLDNYALLSRTELRRRIHFTPHVMSLRTGKGLGNARIIHDLSSLTMSQFHTRDVIETDAKCVKLDADSCDLIFTVSESSRQEVVTYLSVPEDRVVVAYPGVEWTDTQIRNAVQLFDKPYVVILATQEPRKNINLVYSYLLSHKRKILNEEMIYVFAGPSGWGRTVDPETLAELEELERAGKVCRLGFIHEDLKLALLGGAQYMIFPSFFEGFGSPAAEALSLGTPVVCSCGGSLPEVGGDAVFYFSPLDMDSLIRAIQAMEMSLCQDVRATRETAWRQGQKFSWRACAATILDHLEALYQRKTGRS